jgi:hypothetical protein
MSAAIPVGVITDAATISLDIIIDPIGLITGTGLAGATIIRAAIIASAATATETTGDIAPIAAAVIIAAGR